MTTDELKHEYNEALCLFRKSVYEAVQLHARARQVPLQGIAPTARLMFARIVFMAGSVSRLCPNIEDEKSLWDFTSIALLARSVFESIMFFRYFTAPAGSDEWLARMLVLHLHDNCERARLFEKMNKPADVAGFSGEAATIRGILEKNTFFQGLEAKRQKELLNGYRASILTLGEMGDKYGPDSDTWVFHQFLSHYAHSHPVSFMRNGDQRRDGLANDTDKMYIPGVLRWLASSMDGAIEAYNAIPSGWSGDELSQT